MMHGPINIRYIYIYIYIYISGNFILSGYQKNELGVCRVDSCGSLYSSVWPLVNTVMGL